METQTQATEPGQGPGGTAVAALRRHTHQAHRRLEQQLDVLSPTLSWRRYRALLTGFAAVHQTLDAEIGAHLDRGLRPDLAALDFPARRRTPSLARDLARLGAPLPRPVPLPIATLPGALGALYVSEGALLGGRVIEPHVRRVLGAGAPVAFFGSDGADVPARWASCRRALDRLLVTRAERAEAASTAAAVFDRFAEVLRR